jgi:hypothetical protein
VHRVTQKRSHSMKACSPSLRQNHPTTGRQRGSQTHTPTQIHVRTSVLPRRPTQHRTVSRLQQTRESPSLHLSQWPRQSYHGRGTGHTSSCPVVLTLLQQTAALLSLGDSDLEKAHHLDLKSKPKILKPEKVRSVMGRWPWNASSLA